MLLKHSSLPTVLFPQPQNKTPIDIIVTGLCHENCQPQLTWTVQ